VGTQGIACTDREEENVADGGECKLRGEIDTERISRTRIRMSRMYTNKILTPLQPNPRPVPDHRIMRLVSLYDSTTILG